MNKELFLISSSYYQGGELFAHCMNALKNFLGEPKMGHNRILFIPFAKADGDYDGYTKLISEPFKKFGYEVVGIHTYQHPTVRHTPSGCYEDETICAVYVGGGNTWLLNYELQNLCIAKRIKEKVEQGEWKYISASAGTVVACPSMLTTNDMAPILPYNADAIGLVPFQINPHFIYGPLMNNHRGETREERIRQVILHNPDWQVVGLQEGSWIEGKDEEYILQGNDRATIFRKDGNNSLWRPDEPFDSIGML
jgi:dipeptidase E